MSFQLPELLYMFEFVIDDLIIIRKNLCAPDEYPTCVEFTFRSNVYVTLCDREYGACVDESEPRTGKCCIFPLKGEVKDNERLYVNIYKKRTDCCKFLIGMAEMEVKPLFDYLNDIDQTDTNWLNPQYTVDLPKFGDTRRKSLNTVACFDPGLQRMEQLCPSFINVKNMLPIFNLYNQQIGNIVLKLRLLCHGPTIVAEVFKKGNKMVAAPRRPDQDICYVVPEERGVVLPPKGHRYFARNANKLCPCDTCEDEFDRPCPTVPAKIHPKRIVKYKKVCKECAGVAMFPEFISYENIHANHKVKKNRAKMSGKKSNDCVSSVDS
ncbi:PREDICTED: uncharacterized protein LOC108612701 [Drosophila arizonae]|uniref:Uncharacterized protein LOC108612701 n=1 Tax=Drosophila arizonae TaxID=7263 RepID=A0ABM1P1R2_DROAR|nr:PREDICTED: uncharacterized protein LOC108612701 [Drosophila arizonae]